MLRSDYAHFAAKPRETPKTVLRGGLEPPIFGLGDRRLIHWATRASLSNKFLLNLGNENICSKVTTNICSKVTKNACLVREFNPSARMGI